MDLATLAVLLLLAAIAAVIGRALAGYSLSGCLITYALACLGAVAGWLLQRLIFGEDNLVVIPWGADPAQVSVIGASIGAFLLAFIGGLLGRPVEQSQRRRSRR